MENFEDMISREAKRLSDGLSDGLFKSCLSPMNVSSAVAHENIELTLDKIIASKRAVDRINKVYVIASDMIPEDALGILWVRREDAEKWNKKER